MKCILKVVLTVSALCTLTACGQRNIRIDLVPANDAITGHVVEQDPGLFIRDKIAVINITGLISNSRAGSFISEGHSPTSDLRETLHGIAADPGVKAVILRLNTPGGTVTAADMMYRDILAFKKATHKPVIAMMTDVCASGGFYISCAADYRIAYPTSITGSIGVIIETINFTGSLQKLGISTEAITSGPNKDVGSPFRPINENDRKFFRYFVDQFYAQFLDIVKTSHPKVDPANWGMLTDGRVVSGTDAAKYGLIDQVGDFDAAIGMAKKMGNINKAKILLYTREDDETGSVYAKSSPPSPKAANTITIPNFNLNTLEPLTHPQFLYMWMGQ